MRVAALLSCFYIPVYGKHFRLNNFAIQSLNLNACFGNGQNMVFRNNKILTRVKKTEKQKNLGASGRENNVKNAFKMVPNGVQYLSAMLIDDIYTTGATICNASDALIAGGIENIYYISLSIGRDV